MISGISHITLSVSDVARSKRFYEVISGESEVIRYLEGKECHLLLGDLWLALIHTDNVSPSDNYSHIAFRISEDTFSQAVEKIKEIGAPSWQENRTYGDSYYFLDPDGHKLEIHSSDWRERFELSPLTLKVPTSIFLTALRRHQSKEGISIRKADLDDFDRICEIEIKAHQAELHSGVRIETARDIESFQEALKRIFEKGRVFLGFAGGEKAISFIAVSPSSKDPENGFINMLATDPICRGTGIAPHLLSEGAKWLSESGCKFINARTYNIKLIQWISRSPLSKFAEKLVV